jgi:hypothetical protein
MEGSGTSRSYASIARDIQKIREGTTYTISDIDRDILFREGEERDSFAVILALAIENKSIAVDDALVSAARTFSTRKSLYIIAQILRLGGNPNLYVEDEGLEQPKLIPGVSGSEGRPLHLIAYIYYHQKVKGDTVSAPTSRLNMLMILLIYYGANPNLPVRPSEIGVEDEYSYRAPEGSLSVLEWLDRTRIDHSLRMIYPSYSEHLSPESMTVLAILVGVEEMIPDNQILDEEQIEKIIVAGTNSLLDRGVTPTQQSGPDMSVIYWSVQYFNLEAFKYYSTMGLQASYPMINTLLLRMKQYVQSGDVLLYSIYLMMLDVSISNGNTIDTNQQSLLQSISSEAYTRIMNKYKQPYWVKTCSYRSHGEGTTTPRLERVAILLDLSSSDSRDGICGQLSLLSEHDTETLVRAATTRQHHRVISRLASIPEFISGQLPKLTYFNQSSIDGDYDDYVDLMVSSYRDSAGRIWAFTSSNYDLVLETKRNPIDGSLLPERYLSEVRWKVDYLSSQNIDYEVPLTHRQCIETISLADTVDNTASESELASFYSSMSERGVTREGLGRLTAEQLDLAVLRGGYDASIKRLTKSHALTTTAYVVNYYLKENPGKAELMIQYLRDAVATTPILSRDPEIGSRRVAEGGTGDIPRITPISPVPPVGRQRREEQVRPVVRAPTPSVNQPPRREPVVNRTTTPVGQAPRQQPSIVRAPLSGSTVNSTNRGSVRAPASAPLSRSVPAASLGPRI